MSGDHEKKQFHELFLAFDSTGEGQLDRHEFREGYLEYYNGDYEKAEKVTKEIFQKLDLNNNGKIDYSEFLILNMNIKDILQEERLSEVFCMFDQDGSGCITADEIKKVLGGNSIGIEEEEWDKIVDEVDENGDGEISFQEFKDMIYLLLSVENPNKPDLGGKKKKKIKKKVLSKKHKANKEEE
jgi:calcium-dependent protein kinase